MTGLLNLQRQFQHFLLSGQNAIADSIVKTELVSVETRLKIYKDAYKLRLTESLGSNFPALYLWLGDESFSRVCSDYIDAHPSIYRSIRWYGDNLTDFLKSCFDDRYPFLTELADFEWNLTLAFDAADAAVLQIEEMAAVSPELWAGLRFKCHPSVKRLNYDWNVVPLWQALTDDTELPELSCVSKPPTPWILWRAPDLMNHFYSMSVEESWALDSLIQGLSFGEICEGLCQWVEVEEVGMRAASYLKGWIQKGLLSEYVIEPL